MSAAHPPSVLGANLAERQNLLKYQAILDNASVGIAFTRDRVFQHANPAFEDMFGWPHGGLTGQSGMVVWNSLEDYQEFGSAVGPLLAEGKSVDVERMMKRHDGSLRWCRLQARPVDPSNPVGGGTIWIVEDESERRHATERLQQMNEELEHRVRARTEELAQANAKLTEEVSERLLAEERARQLALHDALTGLPNRRLLQDRLAQALAHARRENWQVAVLFIDVDRFKAINDSLGHAAGDDALRETARRLKGLLRDADTVARIGGDEFVIILPHANRDKEVEPVAAKIMSELSAPFFVAGRELRVTVSIGISIFPDDGDEAHKLLAEADAAMYHAKAAGRRNVQFYATAMSEAAHTRLRLENELHRAIERNELTLHYQPRISLDSNRVCGFEALVRWNHPQDGLLLPGSFIRIAEETGQILLLGEWVLKEACAQMVRWREAGETLLPVAINVSAQQFLGPRLEECVAALLKRHDIPAELLELEITETALMENTDSTTACIGGLKRLGVKLAIDDFGTGFSSLAYLRRFRVDSLKIDRSFIRDIGIGPDHAAIIRAIVSLAHSLQLRVVAEGVETEEQLFFLRACGCEEAQGFLFSKAVPAASIATPLAHAITRR